MLPYSATFIIFVLKKKFRTVAFYKSYFEEFFETLKPDVQEKFIWTIELIEDLERVPSKYLKYINSGLYEIRVKVGSNIYRVFAFFNKKRLIVIINGYQKKSQKVPQNQILIALRIKRKYEEEQKG